MDILDSSFMELLSNPIPEDVISLALENQKQKQVSGTHTPVAYCPPQLSQVHPKAAFKRATNVTQNASCKEKKTLLSNQAHQHAFLSLSVHLKYLSEH